MKKNAFGLILAVYLILAGLMTIAGDIPILGLPIVRFVTGALAIAAGVLYFVQKK